MAHNNGKRDSRGKRADVIRAAVNEFQASGYLETSMDRIAEAANVSKRTVYNHFASKEALFDAIVETLVARCGNLQFPEPSSSEPLAQQLQNIGRGYAEMMTSDDFIKLSRVVLSRFIQSPQGVGSAITGREPQQPIQQWMESAQARGLLPAFDTRQATTEFAGLITATEFWPTLFQDSAMPDAQGREQYLASIVAMFLKHYAPDTP
ncbi:MAG: TetR/AcrR family transcriptional regulator [Parahaliea sp.]